MARTTLSARPRLLRFDWTLDREAQSLIQTELAAQEAATKLVAIRRPEQLMLDAKGFLGDRLQYSSPALPMACGALVPGLSQVMKSLINGADSEDCDLKFAVKLYNDVLKRRFAKLSGRLLVVDTRTGIVDGIISERYAYLSNSELFTRSLEFVEKADHPARFHTGVLYGRRLMIRYRHPDPLFTIPTPTERKTNEPFFGGYHFCNSETGDCTVRGATLIIRQFCDNQAIGELAEGGRISHVRSNSFEQKLAKLFEKLNKKSAETSKYRDAVLKLLNTSLDLEGDTAWYEARVKALLTQLRRFGLTNAVARAVLGRALAAGSYNNSVNMDDLPSSWLSRSQEGFSKRNEYDVFNAMTSLSKSFDPVARERLEQQAFGLLAGRFRFKPGVTHV